MNRTDLLVVCVSVCVSCQNQQAVNQDVVVRLVDLSQKCNLGLGSGAELAVGSSKKCTNSMNSIFSRQMPQCHSVLIEPNRPP